MLKNYLITAWRSLLKQKFYSIIKITGFAAGIAACLLILLFIQHELSYDKHIPNSNRVYRVVGEADQNGKRSSGISFPAPMAKALKNDYPEIEAAGRIMYNKLFGGASNQIRRPEEINNNYEEGFCFADSSLPGILGIKMIYGNRQQALAAPNSVILCKSLAQKYFPNQDPTGKTLVFNDNTKDLITIGGVMEDFPANSHLQQYRGFISLAGINFWNGEQETWNASNYGIYLQLRPGVNIESFNNKMTTGILDKYVIPAMKADGQTNAEDNVKGARLVLQPVTDIHLQSFSIDEDHVKHGDIRFVWLFAGIAVFILLLACINFLNLSTAKAANRAKEVGLRKTVGSGRTGLIAQFLTESILHSFLSVMLAVVLAVLTLPVFNKAAGTQLSIPWSEWWMAPLLIAFTVVLGVLAGLYPSFYLSRFKPIAVLKGNLSSGNRNKGLRSTLVVFQFTVSIILLIGTMVVYNQMQYILNSKIGFDRDQVVLINGANALRNRTNAFGDELRKLSFVKNVSVSDFLPVAGTKRNGNTFWPEGKLNSGQGVTGQHWVVDENYISTLGMKLAAGRNFSKEMPTDSQACIINTAMAEQLGYTEPLGKKITNGQNLTIIGVVDNFYFESIRQKVAPLCLVLGSSNSMISIKMNASGIKEAMASITATWKKFMPHQPLRYEFLDESYAAMYTDVKRMQNIFTGFSILAIVVACLGLFALSAFMAEQKQKEIGIRKVLGASVPGIAALLSRDFIKLVFIAVVIASPVAWWAMNKWLQDFAYRINISWWVFVLAAVSALLIALFTVSFQAIKAAVANPVKSLRTE